MPSERAIKLARRISAELNIKITGDDPIIALMLFQEDENIKAQAAFQQNQLDFIKNLTEKLKSSNKPEKKSFLIPVLLVVNICLTLIAIYY
jgi:hypothetical protein